MINRYEVKTEEEWHILRQQCITASEAAVLIGQNPYSSPGKLKQASEFKGNAYTLIGQVMEPLVVDVTNRVLNTSFKLYEVVNSGKVFYTKGKLGATPDAVSDCGRFLLECKSTKPDTFLKYVEVPPATYLVQVHVQMHCTGIEEAYLAILSTDLSQKSAEICWPIAIYKVKKSNKLCELMEQEAARFYASDSFRVNSNVKRQASTLLHMSYEQIYKPKIVEQQANGEKKKQELRDLLKQTSNANIKEK